MLATLILPALAAEPLADRLAQRATQPDVVLVPPVGEPSPQPGSFVVPYAGAEAARAGTHDLAPSSCSSALTFKSVPATEQRDELWLVETGVAAKVGIQGLGLSGGFGRKQVAGLSYVLQDKLVLDGGLAELEECCLKSPERCTGHYVSELWRGTGSIHRLASESSGLKAAVKDLEALGSVSFGNSKAWSVAATWDQPMYFAYRVQAFQLPSCESYMNDLPELDGKVLFTGVSKRQLSEQQAREDARADARMQVVRFLGEELKLEGDGVVSSAEAVVSGVKDALTCLDPVTSTPEGPAYLARVRMYVDRAELEGASAKMRSAK